MKCPNCGIETDGQSSYCYQCGAKIERENPSNVTDNGNNAESNPPLNVTSEAIPVSMPKKKKLFVPVICFLVIFAILVSVIFIPKIIDSRKSSGSYSVSDDFSIEGKWKNIGDTTCAQIQSGSIVDFDGSNCNVYSPNDTYAFYRVDGEYQLVCTSGFAGDSLCFTVNIIDSDNIELINGSTTVHLCRVGGTPVDSYDYNTDEDSNSTQEPVFVYNKENGPICIDIDNYQFTLFQYVISDNEYHEISSFDISGYSTFVSLKELGNNLIKEQLFNSDLTKIAVSWSSSNEGSHVGWIDSNGNLTDVTNLVHPATSGFSSVLPNDRYALFTSTDLFFFFDENANKYCYYDIEEGKVIKNSESDDNIWTNFQSLDCYDEPLELKTTSNYWRGDPNNTFYRTGIDYLTTSQGELHLGIYDESLIEAYIQAWGPGFSDINFQHGVSDNAYYPSGVVSEMEKYRLTPESQYDITQFVARGSTLLFCGRRGSENVLFKTELNDFKLSEPEALGDKTYDLLFWQK